MAEKQTYEALARRLKRLELEVLEQRRARESLLAEKAFSETLIDCLPGIFYCFDGKGKFLRWNKNLEEITGHSGAEISRISPPDLFEGREKDHIAERIQETFDNGSAAAEAELVSRTGERVCFYFTGMQVFLDDVPCLMGMGIDITERRQTEAKLRVAHDEMEKRVAERTTALSEANETLNREIEERKAVEQELRESETRYRLLFENAGALIQVFDREGICRMMNETMAYFHNGASGDFVGKSILDFNLVAAHEYLGRIKEIVRTGKEKFYDEMVAFSSGETRWLVTNAQPLRDSHGRVFAVHIISQDLTDHKRAELAFKESEERLRSILDNTTSVIYLKDLQGKYLLINKQFETLFYIPKDRIIGKTDYDIFTEEAAHILRKNDQRVFEKDGPLEFEENVLLEDGIHTYISIKFPLRDAAGASYGICGISTDITERKRAGAQIRMLTRELIAAQENERLRISRELHDNVGQDLSASRIACELFLDHYPDAGPEIREKVSDISHRLNASISAVRNLAYDLRPYGIEELGLVHSVYLYCEDFSEHSGVKVDFRYTGVDDLQLSLDAEINIYRLIQEGLANIRKHANATNAMVKFIGASPNLILRIEDNGRGFDVEKRLAAAMDEKRMGLRNMEERIKLFKGQMKIYSRPQAGTFISVRLPYKEIGGT